MHYLSDYRYRDGWHEVTVSGLDAQGGAMRLSTRHPIGFLARDAWQHGWPVHVKWSPKPHDHVPGEAYLDAIEVIR